MDLYPKMDSVELGFLSKVHWGSGTDKKKRKRLNFLIRRIYHHYFGLNCLSYRKYSELRLNWDPILHWVSFNKINGYFGLCDWTFTFQWVPKIEALLYLSKTQLFWQDFGYLHFAWYKIGSIWNTRLLFNQSSQQFQSVLTIWGPHHSNGSFIPGKPQINIRSNFFN